MFNTNSGTAEDLKMATQQHKSMLIGRIWNKWCQTFNVCCYWELIAYFYNLFNFL